MALEALGARDRRAGARERPGGRSASKAVNGRPEMSIVQLERASSMGTTAWP